MLPVAENTVKRQAHQTTIMVRLIVWNLAHTIHFEGGSYNDRMPQVYDKYIYDDVYIYIYVYTCTHGTQRMSSQKVVSGVHRWLECLYIHNYTHVHTQVFSANLETLGRTEQESHHSSNMFHFIIYILYHIYNM